MVDWVEEEIVRHEWTGNVDNIKRGQILVRCKDCKYWSGKKILDYNMCNRWINVGVKNFATHGDWFCADGERDDNND